MKKKKNEKKPNNFKHSRVFLFCVVRAFKAVDKGGWLGFVCILGRRFSFDSAEIIIRTHADGRRFKTVLAITETVKIGVSLRSRVGRGIFRTRSGTIGRVPHRVHNHNGIEYCPDGTRAGGDEKCNLHGGRPEGAET